MTARLRGPALTAIFDHWFVIVLVKGVKAVEKDFGILQLTDSQHNDLMVHLLQNDFYFIGCQCHSLIVSVRSSNKYTNHIVASVYSSNH
jgi:hypothetical protein